MTIIHKIKEVRSVFELCKGREELYQTIMEMGKQLPLFKEEWKVEENRVAGCQSLLYLHSELKGGLLVFYASSDALISSGLAALLIAVYSEEAPESILLTPPKFIEEMGLPSALTPGRANGLASLYVRMKQEALRELVASSSSSRIQK